MCAGPDGGVYLHTDAQAWYLPREGKAVKLVLPKGAVHSLACFQDRLFVSVGEQVLRMEKAKGVPLKPPTPGPGFARLKATGGRLWAVFPHHLGFSRDGKTFEAISFR